MNSTGSRQLSETTASNSLTPVTKLTIGIGGTLLCGSIVFGNLLVTIAILRDSKLRKPQHLLIVSLAIADLLLGLTVLPFSLINEMQQHIWMFGGILCTCWLSMDVLLCTASILNLCLISIDRLLSIRYPLDYPHWRTMKRVLLAILAIWFLSALISLPTIVTGIFKYNGDNNHSFYLNATQGAGHACEMMEGLVFVLYSSMGTFYIPMTVIIVVYINIYREARRRMNSRPEKLDYLVCQSLRNPLTATALPKQSSKKKQRAQELKKTPSEAPAPSTAPAGLLQVEGEPNAASSIAMESPSNVSVAPHRPSLVDMFHRRRKQRRQRERRTTLVLSLILGAFLFCWLPFFMVYMGNSLCGKCVPDELFITFFWIGYCNSAINPVIYTIFNTDYRRAMWQVLHCK